MSRNQLEAVTGAFGYSGKYIARRLLNQGRQVRTLANSLRRRNPFGSAIEVHPFHFDDPDKLTKSLEGVSVSYNTYWVRFNHKAFTHRGLVERIGKIIGRPRPIVSVPPMLAYLVGVVIGKMVGDVVITREEIEGLMADLLHVNSPPVGTTRLTDWAAEHADSLGRRYAGELARRGDRLSDYGAG